MIDRGELMPIKYAGFGIRIGASLIDMAVMLTPIVLNMVNLLIWKSILIYLLISIVSLLYKPIFEWKIGATIGKKILKINTS